MASIADSALFKSVLSAAYQPVMTLLRSFDDMARNHLPQIHSYLDVIIKHNLKDPAARKPGQENKDSKKSLADGQEEADGSRVITGDQPSRVAKAVLQRKADDANTMLFQRQQDKGGLKDQAAMDKAWDQSAAGQHHADARDRMRDGVRSKLQDEERRKQEEVEKARQTKLDKDSQHKSLMVGGAHARTSSSKTELN